MGLPGMTEDVADAILDWMDEDDEVRDYGAEASYYQGLSPPYRPNGPLDTVEELLLVRGVTPQLMFGSDTNRNGMVDVHETSASGVPGAAAVTTGSIAQAPMTPRFRDGPRLVRLPDALQHGEERHAVAAHRPEPG